MMSSSKHWSNFHVGDVVYLEGLNSNKWNGKRAILVEKAKKKDGRKRWKVRLLGRNNQELIVKVINMQKVSHLDKCAAVMDDMFPGFVFGEVFCHDFGSYSHSLESEVNMADVHTECGCRIEAGYESPTEKLIKGMNSVFHFGPKPPKEKCLNPKECDVEKENMYTCNIAEHWFAFGMSSRNKEEKSEMETQSRVNGSYLGNDANNAVI